MCQQFSESTFHPPLSINQLSGFPRSSRLIWLFSNLSPDRLLNRLLSTKRSPWHLEFAAGDFHLLILLPPLVFTFSAHLALSSARAMPPLPPHLKGWRELLPQLF